VQNIEINTGRQSRRKRIGAQERAVRWKHCVNLGEVVFQESLRPVEKVVEPEPARGERFAHRHPPKGRRAVVAPSLARLAGRSPPR